MIRKPYIPYREWVGMTANVRPRIRKYDVVEFFCERYYIVDSLDRRRGTVRLISDCPCHPNVVLVVGLDRLRYVGLLPGDVRWYRFVKKEGDC